MTLIDRSSAATGATVRESTSLEDAVIAGLSVWIVVAVHLDGRAHFLGLPDSFFTWWHLLMYSGLAVSAVVLLAMGVRRRRPHQSLLAAALRPPRGYGWALIGATVFAAGGVGDLLWHTVFGVEAGLDALLSPTHLVLMTGAVLLFSGPALATISKQREAAVWPVPALVASLAVTAVAGFALSYVSAFTTDAPLRAVLAYPEGTPEHYATEVPAVAGLASFVITTLVLVIPTVVLIVRKRIPLGAIAIGVTAMAVLAQTLVDFQRPVVILAAAIGAVVADAVVYAASRIGSGRAAALTVAVAVPLAVWPAVLLALQLDDGVRWSAELAAGSVVLSTLISVIVALPLRRMTTTQRGQA